VSALELSGIVKRFGEIVAVDGVSLSLEPGEVLALVGENGAGKSTLVSVACGLHAPDAGRVRAFGRDLPPGNPRAAIEAGLGAVYQHFMLIGPLTVWENAVLGREPRRFGFIDRRRARDEVAETARRFGLALDLDARVEQLGVAAQQRVEIVKQLWRGARVLILDEPTAVLSPPESAQLIATARSLASGGRSVLFISHKLREVLQVADRIAVLRRGRLVQLTPRSQTTAPSLATSMTDSSRRSGTHYATPHASLDAASQRWHEELRSVSPDLRPRSGLEVKEVGCQSDRGRPALRGVSFRIARGEVLGIAGVDGNGQTELAEVVTGLRPASGTLALDGDATFHRSPAAARAAGVVHLAEDRRRRALCPSLSTEENLALGRQAAAPYARGRRIDFAGRRAKALELMAAFDVRPRDPLLRAGALSGGNQQKLVAARELLGGPPPALIVAVHPSRGLDEAARGSVQGALRAARDRGACVLLVSLDLDELRELSDRILVLFEGRRAGEAPPDASDEQLGRMMLGQGQARA
jgi:simple sugar transport system ATP-binding protein